MGYGRSRKRFGYRDQAGSPQEAHVAGWEGFEFDGGPWQVVLAGKWGKPQVWASSAEEGKRVLLHAAALAGYDPENDPTARWEIVRVTAARFQRVRRFGVRQTWQGPQISKRESPVGFPVYDSSS